MLTNTMNNENSEKRNLNSKKSEDKIKIQVSSFKTGKLKQVYTH